MIQIEMLPAAHGDCLWVEWSGDDAQTHRMLIDGGPAHTYPRLLERLVHLPPDQRIFELLVITHVDADHIEGIVRLLLDADKLNVRFKRVWFNGRDELDRLPNRIGDDLGAVSGEYLSMLVHSLIDDNDDVTWNDGFDDNVVRCDAGDELPVVQLPGGLTITVVSPDLERLHDLDDRWEQELERADITSGSGAVLRRRLEDDRRLRPLADELGGGDADDEDGDAHEADDDDDFVLDDELGGGDGSGRDFGDDKSPANGSSIAFVAEWEDGPSVLFAGDAFAGVLEESITKLIDARGATKLNLDLFKIPHHGSVGNLTPELLDLLRCKGYLVSSSGALFHHPHQRAIELLVEHHGARCKPRLHFNYRSDESAKFESGVVAEQACVVTYPAGNSLML